MRTITWLLLVPLIPALAACGGGGGSGDGGSASGRLAAGPQHPCDAFTVADVASHFAIEQDAITVDRGEPGANVICTYEWAKPDAEEIEKRNEAIYMEGVMSGKSLEATALYERTANELSITFNHSGFGSSAEAVQGLDTMVERLREGMTASAGGQDQTFSSEFVPATGIGDKAVWSESMRQVSAVSGTQLYHVRQFANKDPSDDRPGAEEIARKIAELVR